MISYSDNPPITSTAVEGQSVFLTNKDAGDRSAWSAAYTKPRQEKALAFDLLQLGMPYFLPLVEKVTVSGGRRRRGLYPLFSSYVFFREDEATRLAALRTNRIVQIVSPPQSEQHRFRTELQAFEQTLLHSPDKIELHPRIVNGTRARVTAGAMQGVEGVVVNSDRREKIWLQIKALGTGALVEVSADLLEII